MNEPFTIRQFHPNDIKDVVSINQRCLPENYPDQFFMGLFYHAPKAFYVAEYEGEIIGYIMCRIERGISGFGRMPVKKGHIVSVAVLQSMRHKGIGTALINAGMEGMKEYGASEFFLEAEDAHTTSNRRQGRTEQVFLICIQTNLRGLQKESYSNTSISSTLPRTIQNGRS